MRRTAWLVLSPWLAVAVANVVAWGVGLLLVEAFTTDEGGMGNLGGAVVAALLAGLVSFGGSVWLLYVVARRTFPHPHARAAAGWATLAAVVGAVLLGFATGLLTAVGVPFMAGLVPVSLPAAGTVAFLITERRLTGRVVPMRDGARRGLVVAALAALAGGLVGTTVGGGLGFLVLRPSQSDLEAAARDLVPPGYTPDEPVPIAETVMLLATPPTSTPDVDDVQAAIVAAGWRIDDVKREVGATSFTVARANVEGTVSVDGPGFLSYSVTVRPGPHDGRSAIGGAALGAAIGGAGTIVRRRRSSDVAEVGRPEAHPPKPHP
ncbi:hypothetical protein [Cellulomonas chengniuliangii]|uniref:Uncharacterized protein n=1 Tax=Cellulomonas chengniuliangii TaxID=2968084 RepID=A0ABY5L0X6_9CELL|nr:hypothetical protein [Cellulomonas chengniuliangii]MCC2309320.1 hypothetical protein [Cellulomonas chengniuliangii]MCC2316590.1 hypothetical protein [Cellulomonas chengniuliangii]UUI75111.1 hypothetical protein NP064_15260 [Cellulomonas chengniuliangii]